MRPSRKHCGRSSEDKIWITVSSDAPGYLYVFGEASSVPSAFATRYPICGDEHF